MCNTQRKKWSLYSYVVLVIISVDTVMTQMMTETTRGDYLIKSICSVLLFRENGVKSSWCI